jgi:hypothetical protein
MLLSEEDRDVVAGVLLQPGRMEERYDGDIERRTPYKVTVIYSEVTNPQDRDDFPYGRLTDDDLWMHIIVLTVSTM